MKGSSRAAARSNGEVFLAVFGRPFLVSACNDMLESCRVGRVSRDGNVNSFKFHDRNAFVRVVRAVAAYLCSFTVGVSLLFYDLDFIGIIVVLGLNVSEAVDSRDDISRVFAETVKDDSEGLFANFVRASCYSDSALGSRE